MSMFDNLKSKLGIDTEADSYIDDTEDEIFAGGQGAPQQDYEQPEVKQHSNKVVNINATTQLQVVLVKPERFEDASTIADQLNAKRTVVLNLESTGKEVSRRLIDFLSGVAYANNGQIKRVATSTFIITPYNVDIMGDLIDELENNGVFFCSRRQNAGLYPAAERRGTPLNEAGRRTLPRCRKPRDSAVYRLSF